MLDDYVPAALKALPLKVTIASAIRRAIVTGELAPDQRLDEQSLADKFSVSRIPIREALALLERDGLVRSEPRRGTFVVGLTDENVHDIYEFRHMIELYAVRYVTRTSTADTVAQLRSVVAAHEAAKRDHLSMRVVECDLEFHRELVTLADNTRALAAWEMMADLLTLFMSISDSLARNVPLVHDPEDLHRHAELVDVIERQDVEAAVVLWQEHLKVSEQAIHESIKRIRSRT